MTGSGIVYVAAAIVAVAGLAMRAVLLSRFTRRVEGTRQIGADGIVVGGGPIDIAGAPGAPRLLLLHGAGDTPQTLEFLARSLAGQGYAVRAPLLPGHGRSLRDFGRVTADALQDAALGAYTELASDDKRATGIVGLSMGGALAVLIAAAEPELPALVLLAPYLAMPPRIERAATLSPVWGLFAPVVSAGGEASILDPDQAARNLAYGAFTPAALRALRDVVRRARTALPDVRTPTLMIQSRTDNRIDARAAEAAFQRIGAREKRLQWVTGAAHVITVDYGKEKVAAAVADWMTPRLAGSVSPSPSR